MENYSDLYQNEVIVLNKTPTFELIRSYFSDTDTTERTFDFNGRKVIAQRKFTYKGNSNKMYQIKTNYLHIWIQQKKYSSTTEHYRECKDGTFTII